MKLHRLNEVVPGWLTTGGIFAKLQTLNVPWKTESSITAAALDLNFHGNVAGDKPIAPIVEKVMQGNTLTDAELSLLAVAIFTIYATSWAKEWLTRSLTYDPIENYSMTEQMTNDITQHVYGHQTQRTDNLSHTKTGTETQSPDLTDERTANLTHAKTGTEEQAPDLTDEVTHDTSDERTDDLTDATTYGKTDTRTDNLTQINSVSAYNLSSVGQPTSMYSPSGKTENTGTQTNVGSGTDSIAHTGTSTLAKTGTDTTTKQGTDTLTFNTSEADTGTDTMTHTGTDTMSYNTTDADTGTQTHLESGTNTDTRNYMLTRSGNIGVTTSQQMIQSERDLWMWNYFTDVVFPDVAKVLTLRIY